MTEQSSGHGSGYSGIGAVINSIEQPRPGESLPPHEELQADIQKDRLGMLTPFILAIALLGVTFYFGIG